MATSTSKTPKERISLPESSKYPSSTVDVDQIESQRAACIASPNAVEDDKEDGCADSDKTVDTPCFEKPVLSPRFTSRIANRKLSQHQERRSLVHFSAVCWSLWLIGWNNGTPGPMLPRIQVQYNIGFTLVSLVFVASCVGFGGGTVLNIWLNDRLGLSFGKIIVIGSLFQLFGYAMIIPAPPFPLLVCAYLIVGFGLGIQNAQANAFFGSLKNNMRTKRLGVMQGAFGLGAFISPFPSTYFAKFSNHQWSYHFILSATFSLVNLVILLIVFRLRRQEEILLEAGQESNAEHKQQQQQQNVNTYRQIFSLKCIPLLAVFALIYIGVEITLGGWIVTFLIHERGGGSSSGYVTSGFFGGLALGRLCLMWLNKLVGEHRIIIFCSIIVIGLESTVWIIPSLIENAVAVSLVGFLLGPMFPILISRMSHILPARLLTGSVSLVTCIGVAGSAALPFITGLMASRFGIGVLQPLMISMMCVLLIVWAFVPKEPMPLPGVVVVVDHKGVRGDLESVVVPKSIDR